MKRLIAAFIACLLFAAPVVAQDADEAQTEVPIVQPAFSDSEEWNALTARVETAIQDRRASNTVLGNLRSELADWRDRFLDRQSLNASRVSTVRAQISALGAIPEDGDEELRVAARRAELNEQLRNLRAPVTLAVEAYTQANGLIGEIDRLIRERQADQFTERTQSPLSPSGWNRTWDALSGAVLSMRGEVSTAYNNPSRRSEFVDKLPAILALMAVAVVGLLRGRAWIARLAQLIVARTRRGHDVVDFVLSLGQIIVPFVGLLAFTSALQLSGMTGRRLGAVVDALPMLGLFPILAHWLAGRLLPKEGEQDAHPLALPPSISLRAHRRFILLGYSLMLFGVAAAFVDVNTFDTVPSAVLLFPLGVLMAWTLYWFGHMLRNTAPEVEDDAPRSFRVTLRALLSRGLMLAALAGVLFAALGYSNAFDAITRPAAVTIFVVAILLLLQRLSVDLYSLLSKSENAAQTALIPVLIGFLLILVALPILAIIWGAQVTDITELWAQFREGFSIGETRISPTSFLLFAVVFVLGYMVTRLIQAALRTTVLPRTKLDAGGQNAIVAGMGYLGIFLAAVIAITTAGIDLSGLAIVAGALSVGIGFGLQNIVSNFVAGIILLIERPISQGDWIEVGGQMGYVRDISVRSTRIETFDRTDVIVPNADLVSNQVTNWTRGNNVGRVIVPVGVAYGTDTEWVTGLLKEIAEAHPMVLLNPPPNVIFQGFGADSLDFEIRAILRDVNYVMSVKSDMNHAIAKKFVEEGIEIPFGQRDIWLRNPESLRFDAKAAPKYEGPEE